ncbi:type VI secretion protein [Azotobacter chroococcum]|uniref:Type VI secretion protein n=1 Tax=Azotobacter chroococcum TaxID=353 RepID=A0A4Q9VP39_9GAMM|nr:type VI secretion protein [Azotobacter chroococcum]NHN77122.1 type VI secretion protein [Azotobacter chroococcum]TBW06732.1 type VI secretion protein [Azotobacter chroococcum subsp. isscasi]TBW10170.1 type VI secretion protein [Azotobacter chroococcum]TBW36553.1 type VI secretion protein [Azotobacter chroococcum]
MKTLCGPVVLLVLALSLVGCGGNYRFDDHQYRPLGDPQALERGQR